MGYENRHLTDAERAEFIANLRALKGDAFVDEIMSAFTPDDFDGCYTLQGDAKHALAEAELRRRANPGHRLCANCGRAIKRHDKWRRTEKGLAHRNCQYPDTYHTEA